MSEENVELVRRLYASFADALVATPDDLHTHISQIAALDEKQ